MMPVHAEAPTLRRLKSRKTVTLNTVHAQTQQCSSTAFLKQHQSQKIFSI